jgi:hypothetical protein
MSRSSRADLGWIDLERQRRTEFFFDGDFRRFVKTLIIGPVRGANFDNQPTILLLLVLNRLVG